MLKIPDCSLGVNLDLMPEELPPGVWSSCRNMRFASGFAERIGGIYNQYTPSVTPYWVHYYETNANKFWTYAGLGKVFAHNGTTETEITPASVFTGGIDDRWTGGVLGGILVMNNGVENPQFWNGNTATKLATLTAWDTNWKCKALRPFKQFLFALNVTKSSTNYRHMVKWSSPADPGAVPASWDAASATTDAGETELAETTDSVVDGLPLGDAFIIYKERSMYRATFIGGQFIWQFQRIQSPYGMMARGCCAETPLGHVFMAVGDIVLFDGQSCASIADGEVRRTIFEEMDKDNFERSFVVTNPIREEVLICYPTRGQTACNKAMVWSWKTRKWGERDLPATTFGCPGLIEDADTLDTWTSSSGTWETDSAAWVGETLSLNETRLMLSRTAPAISAFDYGGQDAGVSLTSFLERVGLAYDDNVKLFKDVYLNIEAPTGTAFTVQLGAYMRVGEAPVYESTTFTVGEDDRACLLVKGRGGALKISHSGTANWRLRSCLIGGRPAAGKF